jgi:hypothetical protein
MSTGLTKDHWTLKEFAALVKQLRSVQKASGSGYKTTGAGQIAHQYEAAVDMAIAWIEKHGHRFG